MSLGRAEVTQHTVPLAGLPPRLDGLRIVHLSDLHVGPFFGQAAVRQAVAAVRACQPDVVALTGDFVNFRSMRHLASAAGELAALQAPLGVFGVLGNHDYWEGAAEVRRVLEGSGVRVLVNEHLPLSDGLWLAGIDDLMSGSPDVEGALDGIPAGSALVLLSHNPTVLTRVGGRACLILAGHTHGGQFALPILGPRRTVAVPGLKQFMWLYEGLGVRARKGRMDAVSTYRYPAGWYGNGEARMYVNRGVGCSQTYPFRIFCPPEVACFTLQPATPR
jgi:predicted MPP superfamily phosphohydrolase